jgi:phosphatidylglycerol:prolipoprotein diacylglycerol transferase
MHPVLFEVGGVTVYSYGFMIALGSIGGVIYMAVQGKKDVGLTFDQANSLFLFIFISAVVGGKVFLFFEDPARFAARPIELLTGRGFVFYGSFLFAVPTMYLFFRKHKLPPYAMLDVMAVTTCLVHALGRVGCFMAGCCYGLPTDSILAVTFTNPVCQANPLNTPLHPTQLYEASYIMVVMAVLLFLRQRKKFYGQLFLVYLLLYAVGRFVLEYFRGDRARGFVIGDYISHSQWIAFMIFPAVIWLYWKWSRANRVTLFQSPI